MKASDIAGTFGELLDELLVIDVKLINVQDEVIRQLMNQEALAPAHLLEEIKKYKARILAIQNALSGFDTEVYDDNADEPND